MFSLGEVPESHLDNSKIMCNIKDIHLKPGVKGWCSWYAFSKKINERKIIDQAKWFAKHPKINVNYILIDDGYTKWGDWSKCYVQKFPNGFKPVVKQIKKYNLKAGIWVAPFAVDGNSWLAKTHPELLVKHNKHLVRHIGFDAKIKYILDIRKKEALNYLKGCIKYFVEECGFELLKLDFLYIIYNKYIPMKKSSRLLNSFLQWIKESYPSVYTIACGCPLIPAVGFVDSMRIGPDVIVPQFEGIPILGPLYNSARLKLVFASINNRKWTKIFWNLDPDAFVCRASLGLNDEKLHLLSKETKNLNGNIFLGDDITKLSKDRINNFIMPLFK
jgi:alpha-galactosidase